MMYPAPKFSVWLVVFSACCVGLLFVFCNSVWPDETEKANPRIRELQQRRLAVLEKIHDLAKQGFADGINSSEDVHSAKLELLAARLDYADTQKDRIKVSDEAVQEALDWQKVVQGMVKLSAASRVDELKAQAYLFETQITRENAEANE